MSDSLSVLAMAAALLAPAVFTAWLLTRAMRRRPCAHCFETGRCGCNHCREMHFKRDSAGMPTGGFVSTCGPCRECRGGR